MRETAVPTLLGIVTILLVGGAGPHAEAAPLGVTISTHAPICVYEDLSSKTPLERLEKYGIVAGDGTEDLPYIVALWTITDGYPLDTPATGCRFAAAIQFYGTREHFVVQENRIVGNNAMTQGLLVYANATNVTINDNAFVCPGCTVDLRGIDIVSTPGTFIVSGNNISGYATGVRVGGFPPPASIVIEANRINGSRTWGIHLASAGSSVIYRNNVSGSDIGAFLDSGATNASVINNTFYMNRIGVRAELFSDGVRVNTNNLVKNAEYGVFGESTFCSRTLDGRMNFWNHHFGANQTGGDKANLCVQKTSLFRSAPWPESGPP
ncbi:MAG: right-handed parallel beta-helix repeat-containing protein [Euryarchaeota archaeon]|nr:right-handed parallel beta-helix repeat-containing protein [Euryarchaeota archaeon]